MFVLRWLSQERVTDDIQSGQRALCIGQVADQLTDREWGLLDERGGHDNLVRRHQFRMLINVDYLEFVSAWKILFANNPDVPDRTSGSRGGSCYEKPETVVRRIRVLRVRDRLLIVHHIGSLHAHDPN